jgi:enoyl-CoA hydratase
VTGAVRLEVEGHLATVTLDRPGKLNALTVPMLEGLEAAADRIDRHPEVRVAILTGTGPKAFCCGADIVAWGGLEPLDMWRRWIRDGHRVFDRLARLRQPLIAVVNGAALGGGLELAATADLRVAEAHATFGLPEARVGAVPGWSGTQRLVRRAGGSAVKRLVLTGDAVDAAEALRLGITDFVRPSGEGLAFARALAATIASRAPVSVQVAKQLVNAAEGEETGAGIEAIAAGLAAQSVDGREGAAAFREKRAPAWRDG